MTVLATAIATSSKKSQRTYEKSYETIRVLTDKDAAKIQNFSI